MGVKMECSLIPSTLLNLDFSGKKYVFSEEIKNQLSPFATYALPDFTEIFKNSNPLNIEIGMGNGEFSVYMATSEPDENFIGFEICRKVFRKAIKRLEGSDPQNLRIINYDGGFFVKILPDGSVHRFFINFPDPWPKKKHNKRRLLKTDFLNILSQKLAPEGILYIATDHEDYGMEIFENLRCISTLDSLFPRGYETDLVDYFPTKYYKKFGIPGKIFFFKMQKVL